MLIYAKLWNLLEKRGMKKTDLTKNKIISGNTLAKLGKNETISSDVICRLCDFLECQPSDIMENVTKKDIDKAEEAITEALEQVINMIATQTGMSKEVLREQFAKHGQMAIEEMISDKSNN